MPMIDPEHDDRRPLPGDLARSAPAGWPTCTSPRTSSWARKVALKLLHHRFAEDQEFVERFRREAPSAAGLSHPNVVSVYDRGEWDGTYYIAMEYLAGPLAEGDRARGGAARPGRGDRHHRADPAGRALRPPARRDPPRSQAPQRDPRRRGPRARSPTSGSPARAPRT